MWAPHLRIRHVETGTRQEFNLVTTRDDEFAAAEALMARPADEFGVRNAEPFSSGISNIHAARRS